MGVLPLIKQRILFFKRINDYFNFLIKFNGDNFNNIDLSTVKPPSANKIGTKPILLL